MDIGQSRHNPKSVLSGFAIMAGIGLVILAISKVIPEETADHARQRTAQEAQTAAARERALAQQAAGMERERGLCRQAEICRRYGEARQECATAGSISACLDIKMKGDSAMYCTGDGSLSYPTPDMPNRVRCAILSWD